MITGVQRFGLFAQGTELPAEGFIHISTLEDDYYEYDDTPYGSGASAAKSTTASTAETSESPSIDGDSSVGSSNGQSAPAIASSEPKPAELSANADSSTTKAS